MLPNFVNYIFVLMRLELDKYYSGTVLDRATTELIFRAVFKLYKPSV